MTVQISRVIGPPGTGKTHYLARQATRAAQKYGAHRILLTSMTRTAAEVLAHRIPQIPPANVGTLHALALRTLNPRPALAETPEGLADWNTQHPARQLTPAGADTELTETMRTHSAVMAHRATLTPPAAWTIAEQAHHARWTDYKTQTHRADFTDLIEQAIANGPHPAGPAVILIDEAQDLSPLEHQLIDTWAATCEHVVLVGDPDQALFSFRGANPTALTTRTVHHDIVLHQSYRVPKAVHRAAITYHGPTTGTYQPRNHPGSTARSTRTLRHPDGIAHLIARRLDARPDHTLMVLASCRHMIDPVAEQLTRARVPIHNPMRPGAPRWNNTAEGHRITAYLEDPWTLADLAAWTPVIRAGAIPDELRELARTGRAGERVAGPDILLQLLGLDHPAARRDLAWLAANLAPGWAKRLTVPMHHALRRQPWQPRTIVGTVHSVKGGEAQVVILAPDLSRTAAYATGPDSRGAIRRLGYVAITRASEELVVTTPATPERMVIAA